MSASPTIVFADIYGLAGSVRELRALLDELAADSRAEPGCESYRVLSSDEPAAFVVVSIWLDDASLQAHYQEPHYLRYRRAVGQMLARPSAVTMYRVDSAVTARDPDPPDPAKFD